MRTVALLVIAAGCIQRPPEQHAVVPAPAPMPPVASPVAAAEAVADPAPVASPAPAPDAVNSHRRRRRRYAPFYIGIKQQVAAHWHPEEAYRRRDPTGAVYGKQNRYTELSVELGSDGRLRSVRVEKESGLAFLDDEAVEAFKEASPFKDLLPPPVDADGVVRFRFGFLFDLNVGSGPQSLKHVDDATSAPDAGADGGRVD